MIPAIFARALGSMGQELRHVVHVFRGGKQVTKLQVIAVEFVYSIKTRRQIHSHAKCTYQVLARLRSLLFARGHLWCYCIQKRSSFPVV